MAAHGAAGEVRATSGAMKDVVPTCDIVEDMVVLGAAGDVKATLGVVGDVEATRGVVGVKLDGGGRQWKMVKGKSDSSKTTCREMSMRWAERSSYRYPL